MHKIQKAPKRTKKIQKQIETCLRLQKGIYAYLEAQPELDESVALSINTRLSYLREAFCLKTVPCSIENVDRTKSMLSGPLFTSATHPQPIDAMGKKMLPVAQFDLQWINVLCEKDFEPAFFQCWFDHSKQDGFIRQIPLTDIRADVLVEFEMARTEDAGTWLIPEKWSYPYKSEVLQVIGLESEGMSCPGIVSRIVDYEVPDEIADLVATLELEMNYSPTHLFGEFDSLHVSVEEMGPENGCGCFMSIGSWGMMGEAQIFHWKNADGSNGFSFASQPR